MPGEANRNRATMLAFLGMFASSSCAHAAKEAAGAAAKEATEVAVPSGIEESLMALNEPENQSRLRNFLDAPDYEDLGRRLALGFTEGALLAASPETSARLAAMGSQVTRAVGRESGVILREVIGPSMRSLLVEELGPALGEVLHGPVGAALASTSGEVARAAARGAVDGAFGEAGSARAAWAERLAGRVATVATVAGVVVGLALLAFVAWMIWLVLELRRARLEGEKRDVMLWALVGAMQADGRLPRLGGIDGHGLTESEATGRPARRGPLRVWRAPTGSPRHPQESSPRGP